MTFLKKKNQSLVKRGYNVARKKQTNKKKRYYNS